jgi:D-3-phosphoglycerate dehydrogenase
MFGEEVADIAVGYVIGLARETFLIDREIRKGNWPKNRGISLAGKSVGLIGYGDIGKNTAKRLKAIGMELIVYDPAFAGATEQPSVRFSQWPKQLKLCDFLVFTCALNEQNRHMLNADTLAKCKRGVRIVNVARGPLIDEHALIAALKEAQVYSVALDVFEEEPLPVNSPLRDMPLCIFGSHNGSNTVEGVRRTSSKAIGKIFEFLGVQK